MRKASNDKRALTETKPYMKTQVKFVSFILALLLFAAISTSAQDQPPKQINIGVRGVSLDSSYDVVQKRLGKPIRKKETRVADSDECGITGKIIELDYTGMTVTLHKRGNAGQYEVTEMVVTGSRWMRELNLTRGVTTVAQVRARFGRPVKDERISGARELSYTIVDGEQGLTFVFNRAGKLTKVGMGTWLC